MVSLFQFFKRKFQDFSLILDRESFLWGYCVQIFFQEKLIVFLIKILKNKNKKQFFFVVRYILISNSIYREVDLVMVLGLSKKYCK